MTTPTPLALAAAPPAHLIRTLWRLQGPSRIIVAAVHRHPAGRELIVRFESGQDDVLETRFERVDFAVLERRAEALRELLLAKGWSPCVQEPGGRGRG